MTENLDKFINELRTSLAAQTFVKLTLGNYKGGEPDLQKIQVRMIETKKGRRLFFLYRSTTRDTAKNYDHDEGADRIARAIESGFHSAHLFTTERDIQLEIGKKGTSRLNIAKPTTRTAVTASHDREKKRLVDPDAYYLRALGVTNDAGEVRDKQQDKWRQINKFVEIVAGLIERSELAGRENLNIVDMGSGKGYLTFALYDYLTGKGVKAKVTGVEMRPNLIETCSDIAEAGGLENLRFVRGSISDFDASGADILIALHACDTATDDAIYKGIAADSAIIIVAPCCQHELRRQIRPPEMLKDVLKHGIMLERTTEFVTDSLRTLLLERSGYSTTLLDFVSIEHTPKNLMIVGTSNPAANNFEELDRQVAELKNFYGIHEQHLDRLLRSEIERVA
jgi:SAM-dependent methyltransferase